MNAKRIAIGIISACAILGASLLISSDANGCSMTVKVDGGDSFMVLCNGDFKFMCVAELGGVTIDGKPTTITLNCFGKSSIIQVTEDQNSNPGIAW